MILDAVFQEVNHNLNADFGTVFISGGNSPDLNGYIQIWQPNTEYKVGDAVIENFGNGYMGNPRTGVLRCVKNHTSSDYFSQDYLGDLKWEQKKDVWAEYGYRDYLGNLIPEHYATKKELNEVTTVAKTYEGKFLSLLGDSISARQGSIPEGNAHYYYGDRWGVDSEDKMWWKIVCNKLGMTPLVIDGWSGSSVVPNLRAEPCPVAASDVSRCQDLAKDGNTPDVVLVAMGVNDYGDNAPIGNWNGETPIDVSTEGYTSINYTTTTNTFWKTSGDTVVLGNYVGIYVTVNPIEVASGEHYKITCDTGNSASVIYVVDENYTQLYDSGKFTEVQGVYEVDIPENAKYMLITYINGYNNVPIIEKLSTSQSVPTDFRTAYATMLNRIQTAYPNAKIVCITPWFVRRGTDIGGVRKNGIGLTQNEYLKAVEDIANMYGCDVIYGNKAGINEYNFYPTYGEDYEIATTHPNAEGQRIMGEYVANELTKKYIIV